MPLKILEVHFNCASSQNLRGRSGCWSQLRSCCGTARIFGHGSHFSRQAQGKPCVLVVQSRLSRQVQGIGAVLNRSADFVAGAALFGHGGDLRRALISRSIEV